MSRHRDTLLNKGTQFFKNDTSLSGDIPEGGRCWKQFVNNVLLNQDEHTSLREDSNIVEETNDLYVMYIYAS